MQQISVFLAQFQLPESVLHDLQQEWNKHLLVSKGEFLIREGQKRIH